MKVVLTKNGSDFRKEVSFDSKDFIKYLQIINLSYNTLNPGIFKLWNSLLYKFKKPLTIK